MAVSKYLAPFVVSSIAFAAPETDLFEIKVRPVLAANCLECHGKAAMGGLRLDSRQAALKGGKSGAAVVPGDPEKSILLRAVSHLDTKLKMPPKGKLSEGEIAALRTWIESGAVWPESAHGASGTAKTFWSFQPVKKAAVPAAGAGWAKTDTDRFLAAKLGEAGMKPGPEADRRIWIRRVTFDLTGLPPAPEEVAAFLNDKAPKARERAVERLLSSPHYGERWARHWLDLARYSDGRQAAREDTPYANAFRYRDWVVNAFNSDIPYDTFVKAQIAADAMPEPQREKLLPALGFQALGESTDDQLDVTTRVFLGLTVGCARCHDHKYDPIPARDYYSLLGVFKSSKADEFPLVPKEQVEAYKKAKALSDEKKAEIKRFTDKQLALVVDMLASQTGDYLIAAWRLMADPAAKAEAVANQGGLDKQTLERWVKYLERRPSDHTNMDRWHHLMSKSGGVAKAPEAEVRAVAAAIHADVQSLLAEKKAIDDRNYVKLGGIEGMKNEAKVIKTLVDALPVERYYFWRDMASGPYKVEDIRFAGGVYYYPAKDAERFYSPHLKAYAARLREESSALEKRIPKPYPFWHVLSDQAKPANTKVAIRGNAENLGEEAPRRFLSALCEGEPTPFQKGSGRLELAEAIASPSNPLTARVMVNRVWKLHFGEGLVRSTSNFGRNGEAPSHPELLDYLSAKFVESGWSVKALHREMVLSAAYGMTSDELPAEYARKDPENRLLWRANVRERLDAEALRDSLLAVAGTLDPSVGGESKPLTDDYSRRTLYVTVSRGIPNRTMALFDFPDANATAEQRLTTVGPMQRLFFMNSSFVARQSKALAERVAREAATNEARISRAYELLYGRAPSAEETRLGAEFVGSGAAEAWPKYAQVLLSAAEFSAVR